MMMEEWRYVLEGHGAQSVMTSGTTEMPRWCVTNYIMMDVSHSHLPLQGHSQASSLSILSSAASWWQ